MAMVVYSHARAQQLRFLLWTANVLGAASLGLAVFVLLLGGSARFAGFVVVPAVVVLVASMLSLRALADRGQAARVGSLATGAMMIVIGLLLASAVVGILPSIVGILLMLLALLPESGDE